MFMFRPHFPMSVIQGALLATLKVSTAGAIGCSSHSREGVDCLPGVALWRARLVWQTAMYAQSAVAERPIQTSTPRHLLFADKGAPGNDYFRAEMV